MCILSYLELWIKHSGSASQQLYSANHINKPSCSVCDVLDELFSKINWGWGWIASNSFQNQKDNPRLSCHINFHVKIYKNDLLLREVESKYHLIFYKLSHLIDYRKGSATTMLSQVTSCLSTGFLKLQVQSLQTLHIE